MSGVTVGDIVLILVVCAIIWAIMTLVNRSRRARPANIPPIPDRNIGDPLIRHVLKAHRTVAVAGSFSAPEDRDSCLLRYMQETGYTVFPVCPETSEPGPEVRYPSLKDLPLPPELVVVTVSADLVPAWARQAVEAGAKALWIEKGSANPEARRIGTEGGLAVVMELSLEEEHRRLRL